MSSSNLVRISLAEETTYGVPPTAVKASVVIQDITYEAVLAGAGQNAITIEYQDTATAGAETVAVAGNAILVGIQSGVSTATQVKAAIDGSAAAIALVSATITGTAGNPQATVAANLANGAGGYSQARFISEALSGTPDTVESQQIRTDRLSSGQIVTGLTVGGELGFEVAKETLINDMMESAMYNTFQASTPVVESLTIDTTAKTITRATGSFVTEGIVVGDFIYPQGGANTENNTPVIVLNVTALVITYQGPATMVDGTVTGYQLADKLGIGTTKKSFSMEKAFLDLTTKAINYAGMIVSDMSLDFTFGQLATGSFTFSGNEYNTADLAAEFYTNEREILSQATSQTMNGSIDMPFIVTSADGTLGDDNFCLQSLSMSLSNNLTPQNCIGDSAPQDYTPGTASIEISSSAYLSDEAWQLLPKKLDQASFGIGFLLQNVDGWYGFYMPAIQVSFDDPASAGPNQDVLMEMSGQAKVGANGESSLYIYKLDV